jgi:hypothetical protein
MAHTTNLYFECHITIDPVFGEARTYAEEKPKSIASSWLNC